MGAHSETPAPTSVTVDVSTMVYGTGSLARTILAIKEGPSGWAAVDKSFVERFLGERLPEHYTVRYFLDPGGPYLVVENRTSGPVLHRSGVDQTVCFLPREWVGKRVNREHWVRGRDVA